MIIISNKNKLNVAQKGFTLAEVLITLGIIGIIAALTMPALISDYKEKATVAKLKKVYSIFSQVMLQAQAEHG
ncbi:MAG: prepilin-type N-terminal cleavage/methylation domain-containing protein, partial [Heliobacteriaceae bacterium]|nr:prepilin-type N-terminal cleavage/methylation domain-containing protein [Heliobacteriaceae bacterium]